jgi:hypothetical protein
VVVGIADGQVRLQEVLHDGSVATEDDSGRERCDRIHVASCLHPSIGFSLA